MEFSIKVDISEEEIKKQFSTAWKNKVVAQAKEEILHEMSVKLELLSQDIINTELPIAINEKVSDIVKRNVDRFLSNNLQRHIAWNGEQRELAPAFQKVVANYLEKWIKGRSEEVEELIVKNVASKIADHYRVNQSRRDKLAMALLEVLKGEAI